MQSEDNPKQDSIINSNIMKNKIGIVMGVANDRSLAWGVTKALSDNGADIILTYQGEALKKRIVPLSEKANAKDIFECDVSDEQSIKNTFENTIAIQFNHRWIAIFSFFWIITSVSYIYYNKINYVQKIACFTVFILVTIQVIIGILTLINNVPISLASIHQMNAILLYCSLLITYYLFSKKESI